MKICGFTIVRNAVKYDYPVVESITSILPVCDEFIVLAGDSEDSTLDLIQGIGSDKIRIVNSKWDDALKEGGKVLAIETNKAFNLVPDDCDWAIYLQADEVIHEKHLDTIHHAMLKFRDDPHVEGLLFKYIHFYGTYGYIGDSRRWYRNEIRVIRNDKSIHSFQDAQGFRKNGDKLRVKPVDAFVYHYGWVKNPKTMQTKLVDFHKLWHDEEWIRNNVSPAELFDYSLVDSLSLFEGTHPAVMLGRTQEINWQLDLDVSNKKFGIKAKVLHMIEKSTDYRLFEYKNYRIV
jgi:hypothetical protein